MLGMQNINSSWAKNTVIGFKRQPDFKYAKRVLRVLRASRKEKKIGTRYPGARKKDAI